VRDAAAAAAAALVYPMQRFIIYSHRYQLLQQKAMRRGVNALRQEANNLKREVNFLNMEINELQTEIESMEESNAKLQDITNVQDKNMENLVKLVTENQDILDEMRVCVLHDV
jgi:TolA-binding protein